MGRNICEEVDKEEKKTTFLINPYYKTLEFKDKYKQALFFILTEHNKKHYNNNKELPITNEKIKKNRQYLASSEEL